jgi:glycine dehydrogenase subunit 1
LESSLSERRLSELAGWEAVFTAPVYNEFVIHCPDPKMVNRKLEAAGIIGTYDLEEDYPELGNALLFCATEMLTRDDIDRVVSFVA